MLTGYHGKQVRGKEIRTQSIYPYQSILLIKRTQKVSLINKLVAVLTLLYSSLFIKLQVAT